MDPHVYIEYLIRYDSFRIYCIWIPELGIVITIGDVTFNKVIKNQKNEHIDTKIHKFIGKIIETIRLERTNMQNSTAIATIDYLEKLYEVQPEEQPVELTIR